MKYRFLLIAAILVTIVVYVIFKWNETAIIEQLAPRFPVNEENSAGYYADLVSFVFAEAIGMLILVLLTIYYSLGGKLYGRIHSLEEIVIKNKATTLGLALSAYILITVLVATVGLEQFPNSADEFAYLFQAEQLSEGKLWNDVHPVSDFFEFHHLAQKDGKWVSRFPPGWPAVLSVAFSFHIPPFLINTIIGLIAALVFYKLIGELYDKRIAIWSTLIMVLSSFYIFNAATYFSHMASLLEGLLFVFFSYRCFRTGRNSNAIIAGVFLGMLVMTRQLTAVVFLAPFVVYFLYKLKLKAILPLVLIGLGAAPFVGLFLWYNYTITGNAFVPVTMWTNADEALGFVKGHTPVKGAKFTFKRLAMFLYWASPSLLILYFLALLLRLKEYKKILLHPEDYFFLLLMAGYFFYYHSGGNQYGPRFYLEGFPFLVAFVAAKTLRTNYRWAKIFLFLGLVYSVVKIPFIAYREHQVVAERKDVFHQVKQLGISNAVIFIASPTGIMRPMPVEDLNRNDRYYQNDIIYARDLGSENRKLIEYYKGKSFYVYKRDDDVVSGKLVKLNVSETVVR